MPKRKMKNRGITLAEVLVTVVIVVFMFGMINQIFRQTTDAIRRGTTLSSVIHNAHAMNKQLRRDFDYLKGPTSSGSPVGADGSGGLLVILQQRYSNIRVPNTARNRAGERTRSIRADQIYFFADNPKTDPERLIAVPPSTNQNLTSGFAGDPVGIWYGHGLLTDETGSVQSNADLGTQHMQGRNEIGTRWTLMRHVNHYLAGKYTYQQINAAGVRSRGPWHNSILADSATSPMISGTIPSDITASPRVYHGICALTIMDYTLMFDLSGVSDTNLSPPLGGAAFNIGKFDPTGPRATYAGSAYDLLFHAHRMWANNISPAGSTFEGWQIAQAHPIFMPNVSDFIVEFAGDYVNNTTQAVETDGNGDGLLDVDSDNQIIWYTTITSAPQRSDDDPAASSVHALPSGWTSDTGTEPHLTTNINSTGANVIVFRHDDLHSNQSKWPQMIRIRYRLHDREGKMAGENTEQGFWFEQILDLNSLTTFPTTRKPWTSP